MNGPALAAAAEQLVGVPFRLHGRDPSTGLDCIGVLSCALTAIGRPFRFPNGYRLRTSRIEGLEAIVASCGFSLARPPILAGDVLMVRCGPCQFHLLVAAGVAQFVHADAKLGRVVMSGGSLRWPVSGHWRLAAQT